jgi:hypothetical protein
MRRQRRRDLGAAARLHARRFTKKRRQS